MHHPRAITDREGIDNRHPHNYAPGVNIVGYRHEGSIYLMPHVVLCEVNKIQPLKFNAYAIGSQLREDDLNILLSVSISARPSRPIMVVQSLIGDFVLLGWSSRL